MNQASLAAYFEQRVIPDLKKRGHDIDFEFWIDQLSKGRVSGAHSWNFLAGVLDMSAKLVGENYSVAFYYCRHKALTAPAPPPLR